MTYELHDFPEHNSGDTFNGVQFELIINDVAKNITGATFIMKIAQRELGNTYFAITDASAGKFQFKAQIVILPPGTHAYEIESTFADGTKKTYIKGNWTIIA